MKADAKKKNAKKAVTVWLYAWQDGGGWDVTTQRLKRDAENERNADIRWGVLVGPIVKVEVPL